MRKDGFDSKLSQESVSLDEFLEDPVNARIPTIGCSLLWNLCWLGPVLATGETGADLDLKKFGRVCSCRSLEMELAVSGEFGMELNGGQKGITENASSGDGLSGLKTKGGRVGVSGGCSSGS